MNSVHVLEFLLVSGQKEALQRVVRRIGLQRQVNFVESALDLTGAGELRPVSQSSPTGGCAGGPGASVGALGLLLAAAAWLSARGAA